MAEINFDTIPTFIDVIKDDTIPTFIDVIKDDTIPTFIDVIKDGLTSMNINASLTDEQKLPILVQAGQLATLNQVKQVATHWASKQLQDPIAKRLLVNGVCGLIDLGMICTVDNIPDGSWKKIDNYAQIDKNEIQAVSNMINPDLVKRATRVIVSTKANFWQMNHHTHQCLVEGGYFKKDLQAFYFGTVSGQMVHAAHLLGHFASTLKILQMAGLCNLRQVVPFVHKTGASLTLSADIKLRFQFMPAGTTRLAVAFEAAKKMVWSKYAQHCPGMKDFQALPAIRNQIIADPVRYHIRASYLTGQPRAQYRDTDFEMYLGRLGTFITTVCRNSSLAKSLYMQPARIVNYKDYNPMFKYVLEQLQQPELDSNWQVVEMKCVVLDYIAKAVQRLRDVFPPP